MAVPAETPKYGRLRADFIERVNSGAIELPKRQVLGIPAHVRAAMLQGEVLEWRYFEDFLKSLRLSASKQAKGLTIDSLAEPAEAPLIDPMMPDLLYRGWHDVVRFFGKAESIAPLSFCNADRIEDFEQMADLILDSLGWLHFSSRGEQKAASAEAARSKGEELSGMKYHRWVQWLQGLCRSQIRATMFAVENVPYRGMRCDRRLGSGILLGLKEAKWHSLRAGQMGYSELTGDDLQRPSKHLLLHSLSEVRPSEWPGGRKISFAQVRTLMYQMATVCPAFSMENLATWPSILCLAPLHVHQKRVRAFGFKKTDAIEPDTKTTIWELVPPSPSFSLGFLSGVLGYGAQLAALTFFQFVHREEVLTLHD